MIGVWNGLRAIAGEGLVAAGTVLKGRSEFDERLASGWVAAGFIDETTDSIPADTAPMPAVSPTTLGFELDALPDSSLFRMAAHVIEGWKPILILRDEALAATDLDEFLAVLRDRAAQFDAIEQAVDAPFLATADLEPHLAASVHQLRRSPTAAPDPAADDTSPQSPAAGSPLCENCGESIELETGYASLEGRGDVKVGVYLHRTTGNHACAHTAGVDRTYASTQK